MKAVQVAATILVLTFLTLVSWNWFAPDLFGLAEIRFREAFGLVTFAGVFAVLLRFALGERRHG